MLTEEKKPLRLEHWNEKEIEALNKVSSYYPFPFTLAELSVTRYFFLNLLFDR